MTGGTNRQGIRKHGTKEQGYKGIQTKTVVYIELVVEMTMGTKGHRTE